MEKLFLQVLNMSFVGGVAIVFVLIARLLLKKMPKIFSYALWAVVLFRLICPFYIQSGMSMVAVASQPIKTEILYAQQPQINTNIGSIDKAINAVLPAPANMGESVNPIQIWIFLASNVWVLGIVAMLLYSVISLLKLKIKLKDASYQGGRVYISNKIQTAFVLGICAPKIYLPCNLTEQEREYVVLHEQIHIKRFDHIVKMFSFFVLCIHWFNPLVWMAFIYSGRDMEMSCDEAVIKKVGAEIKKQYSSSLLALATDKPAFAPVPLAFGEGNTKGRIKNVLGFKRPAFWIIACCTIAVALLIIGLGTDRGGKDGISSFNPDPATATEYTLYCVDESQKNEYLQGFTLYENGTAVFQETFISSYIAPPCTYTLDDDSLVFYAIIDSEWEEGFNGLKNGDEIARFSREVYPDGLDRFYFESTTELLFASKNGVYALKAECADVTKEVIASIPIGTTIADVYKLLGLPQSMLSGMHGDIYYTGGENMSIIYYDSEQRVEFIKHTQIQR